MDSENMTTDAQKKLFNDTAHLYFVKRTKLAGRKFEDYLDFERSAWAEDKNLENMTDGEIVDFAIEKAVQALDEEVQLVRGRCNKCGLVGDWNKLREKCERCGSKKGYKAIR